MVEKINSTSNILVSILSKIKKTPSKMLCFKIPLSAGCKCSKMTEYVVFLIGISATVLVYRDGAPN